ncbi:thiamine phosphate synthase [Solicola sp. PLA-1-18]|uniref:thiamine phosphate synthase n=1 Tax=Solicola sp. PLA-1-18 TaxID=3380532 RepID=UPI003B77FFDF
MRPDLRLYLVTGPVPRGRDLVEVVAAAVAGGVTTVQLRDKTATTDVRVATARRLLAVLEPAGVPLVVNDDVDAAAAVGAGVHVGTSDAAAAASRSRLGADALVGWSVEGLRQLDATAEVAAASYLAASPVWSTPSKTDTATPLGLAGVTALREHTHLPVVGIGGIDATNAGDVVRAGADGVAVISAICAADDPEAAARGLRAVVDEALAAREVVR